MLVVVERGNQSQGFNSDGGRSEFEGESKVDERVCDCSGMLDRRLYKGRRETYGQRSGC